VTHIRCLPDCSYFNRSNLDQFDVNQWYCNYCTITIFPFNNIDENEYFLSAISELCPKSENVPFHLLNQHFFNPFDFNESNTNMHLFDCDPDLQYFNDTSYINSISQCEYFIEDSFNAKSEEMQVGPHTFSLCHLNIRSIPKNLNDLDSYLKMLSTKFTIIGLTETWLTESNAQCYSIEEYKHYFDLRKNRRGGGISLFVKNHITVIERSDLYVQNALCQSLFIELEKDNLNISENVIIGLIYRPPNTDVREFNEYLSDILEKITREMKPIYLMGDFNINLLDIDNHIPSSEFIELLYSNGLYPMITKPTRIQNNSATLIDNIFHNNINASNFNGILYTDISDHLPIFSIDLNTKKHVDSSQPQQNSQFRNISENNIKKFIYKLSNFDWSSVTRDCHGHSAFKSFYNNFQQMYNECFPFKVIKHKYLNRKPWLSLAMQNSIKLKNKLYLKFKKTPSQKNLDTYKTYKRTLNNLMKKAERQHYHNLMEINKFNTKKIWTILKDIINKKKSRSIPNKFKIADTITSDKNRIANGFNDFFVNIGNSLSKNISLSNSDPLQFITSNNQSSIYITGAHENEVKKIILSLKEASAGWDGIHAKIIKRTFHLFSEPLTHVLNLSLSQGFFPSELKVAKVIPLFKSGDTLSLNNYRPVSILPVFSKILERLMYSRILKFINKHNILYKYQFGFRENYSANMAIITLIDKITSAIDNGDYVFGVFLDLRKAFDTVNHQLLLKKLQKYGIRGIALSWFTDYLHERYQYVNFDNHNSLKKQITCGVPQGSILGPLLFLLYINDISNVSKLLFPVIFADDTNIFIKGKDLKDTATILNSELLKITTWLKANKLSINIDKTCYILFTSRRRTIPDYSTIKINGQLIKCVDHTKFVGVTIDSKLSWEYHIRQCKSKVSKGLGILTKARKVLNSDSLLTLYNCLIYPHFMYCIEVWGTAANIYIDSLFKTQKKAIRIIKSAAFRAETSPLFKELKLLPLAEIYKYCLLLFMFKYVKGSHPNIFNDVFLRNTNVSVQSTRQSLNLRIPTCRTELLQKTLRYKGVIEWNYISRKLDHYCSIHSFKKRLKIYLLNDD
jgi:exonuclease III